MELLIFGFNAQSTPTVWSNGDTPPASTLNPESVQVLWSSWCDAVVASQNNTGSWTVEYRGRSLTANQKEHLTHSENIVNAVSKSDSRVNFFGGAMHEGLRGYVISSNNDSATINQAVIFATDLELGQGLSEVQVLPVYGNNKIMDIKVTSSGDVLLSATSRLTSEDGILHVPSLSDLRTHLASHMPLSSITHTPLASFNPTQWGMNATTSTILDPDGRVYTSTRDPRYPKCLGRPYDGTLKFEPVPYLSETCITKVASGGYMSAAVSSDGELFLWGQACPGSAGQLRALNEKDMFDYGSSDVGLRRTGISVEGEQDEFIKCLMVYIDGEEAKVYDVAVGYGHLLVAAKVSECEGGAKLAVFAAGDASMGQLGLGMAEEFVEEFEEVISLRGKKIEQLVAAGWSSFGVANV